MDGNIVRDALIAVAVIAGLIGLVVGGACVLVGFLVF